MADDPHFDSEHGLLRNTPGITDPLVLNDFERRMSVLRSAELVVKPIRGRFDRNHLCAIHAYLFQDVYPWAGKPRLVNISRESSRFALVEFMTGYLDQKLRELAAEDHLKGLPAEDLASRAAYYLAELNAVHLFREGNGRAQREFIRELAEETGYRINWIRITQEQMYRASKASMMHGNLAQMGEMLRAAME